MIVFTVIQALTNQIKQARIIYNWMNNLLGIPRNNLKDIEGILIIVFKIKINTKNFIARLSNDKLEKVVKATNKVLTK